MDFESPNKFMKPSDVFKLRKRKVTTPSKNRSKVSPCKVPFSPLKCLQNYHNSPAKDIPSPLRLRKTPKKNRIRNSFPIVKKSPGGSPGKFLLGRRKLNFRGIKNSPSSNDNFVDNDENANLEFAVSPKEANRSENKLWPDRFGDRHHRLLVDWSLKTKILFTSEKPFPCRGLRASEEATGTSSFVRCIHSDVSKPDAVKRQSGSASQETLDTSCAARLHHHCLVWSHPNLPWLSLFPRTPASVPGQPMAFKPPTFSILPNSPLADALHADWCASLTSLYQLLKTRQCPYFYACANQFTVLFRAPGIGGSDEIQVLVTPTSSGFRNLLLQEKINFTLPIHNDNDQVENCRLNESLPVGIENNEVPGEDAEEPGDWLESLGLSQQDFPSLQQKRKTKRTTNAGVRKKSLVLIKGMSDSQLFVNFLINSRVCIPNSGPLSSVPPTLLAPVAFHGATLQPLKLKHTKTDRLYSLELSGPILPNSFYGLLSLFKQTQETFKASTTTHEPTRAFAVCSRFFNQLTTSIKAFATESLKDCGLERNFLDNLCSIEHQSDDSIQEAVSSKNGTTFF